MNKRMLVSYCPAAGRQQAPEREQGWRTLPPSPPPCYSPHQPRRAVLPPGSNVHSRRGTSMTAVGRDSLQTRTDLQVGSKTYSYYSLDKAAAQLGDVRRLPFSMKVLLEN